MRVFIGIGASAACLVLAVSTLASAEIARYREFELGASVAAVTAVTQSVERDLKIVHSRPALLQQLEWRPRYMAGAPVAGRESISEIVFSFVDGRLYKMAIAYARERTSGLTNEDMVASITAVYGAAVPASPEARPRTDPAAFDAPVLLAEWRDEDATVSLQRGRYNEAYTLVITSLSLDAVARKAEATAIVMDEREAPARDAAASKKRADEERDVEERNRSTNKPRFRP
jgi:hypothetical protein